MKKIKLVTNAFGWRWTLLKQKINYLVWDLKLLFDFSKKENIDSISIIVVGRNDNYGGDFSKRLQATLDFNFSRLPNSEIIYIEWNRIEDRPGDCKWIVERYKNAKCFIVPKTIHDSVCRNPKMPMMEYFAKNLGIRKATGDWILMINADVFIGNDVLSNMKRLNKDTVYGTHYVSIKWDGKPLTDHHQQDESNVVIKFPAPAELGSVVGNFILTHKKNWLKATGYDESLKNVRAGVDSNGLDQLLYLGLKTLVIGHHYHLDHPESIIHGLNDTHGIHHFKNIPYKNPGNWGLIHYPLKQISDRIWELQKI